jgi:quercetin dioxygenase-like cupin family protein
MVSINRVGIIRNYFAIFSRPIQKLCHSRGHGFRASLGWQRAQTMEEAMNAKPVIRTPGEAKGVVVSGHPMAFLVAGEDTKHTSMCDRTMPPRFSTSLHVHRTQEEIFYVLDGECDWQVGDRRIRATPGTFVLIPPGVPHNIANATDKPARVLMTVSPPGHENYFEELAKAVSGDSPPDAKAIGRIAAARRHRPIISTEKLERTTAAVVDDGGRHAFETGMAAPSNTQRLYRLCPTLISKASAF